MSEIPKNVVGQVPPKFTAEKLEAMREIIFDAGEISGATVLKLISELLQERDQFELLEAKHEALLSGLGKNKVFTQQAPT